MNEQEVIMAIRIFMTVRKLRLTDMAKVLGCTPAHLSGVLTGKKRLTKKILNHFGITKKIVFDINNKEFFAFCFLAKDQIKKMEARA